MPQYMTTHRRNDVWACPKCGLVSVECGILWVFHEARRLYYPLRICYMHGTYSACCVDIDFFRARDDHPVLAYYEV